MPLAPEGLEQAELILGQIRLPRTLLGLAVGAVLALSGVAMQGLFRNPLADPGLVGVSSGAALGAAVAIVGGAAIGGLSENIAPYLLSACAFAGAWGDGAGLPPRPARRADQRGDHAARRHRPQRPGLRLHRPVHLPRGRRHPAHPDFLEPGQPQRCQLCTAVAAAADHRGGGAVVAASGQGPQRAAAGRVRSAPPGLRGGEAQARAGAVHGAGRRRRGGRCGPDRLHRPGGAAPGAPGSGPGPPRPPAGLGTGRCQPAAVRRPGRAPGAGAGGDAHRHRHRADRRALLPLSAAAGRH